MTFNPENFYLKRLGDCDFKMKYRNYNFLKCVTTFGRAKDSDVVLKNMRCSINHCKIFFENGKIFVEDSSSAGTFINNERIRGKKVELFEGTTIGMGADPNRAEHVNKTDFYIYKVQKVEAPIELSDGEEAEEAENLQIVPVSNENRSKENQNLDTESQNLEDGSKNLKIPASNSQNLASNSQNLASNLQNSALNSQNSTLNSQNSAQEHQNQPNEPPQNEDDDADSDDTICLPNDETLKIDEHLTKSERLKLEAVELNAKQVVEPIPGTSGVQSRIEEQIPLNSGHETEIKEEFDIDSTVGRLFNLKNSFRGKNQIRNDQNSSKLPENLETFQNLEASSTKPSNSSSEPTNTAKNPTSSHTVQKTSNSTPTPPVSGPIPSNSATKPLTLVIKPSILSPRSSTSTPSPLSLLPKPSMLSPISSASIATEKSKTLSRSSSTHSSVSISSTSLPSPSSSITNQLPEATKHSGQQLGENQSENPHTNFNCTTEDLLDEVEAPKDPKKIIWVRGAPMVRNERKQRKKRGRPKKNEETNEDKRVRTNSGSTKSEDGRSENSDSRNANPENRRSEVVDKKSKILKSKNTDIISKDKDLTPKTRDITSKNHDMTSTIKDITSKRGDITIKYIESPDRHDITSKNQVMTTKTDNITSKNTENPEQRPKSTKPTARKTSSGAIVAKRSFSSMDGPMSKPEDSESSSDYQSTKSSTSGSENQEQRAVEPRSPKRQRKNCEAAASKPENQKILKERRKSVSTSSDGSSSNGRTSMPKISDQNIEKKALSKTESSNLLKKVKRTYPGPKMYNTVPTSGGAKKLIKFPDFESPSSKKKAINSPKTVNIAKPRQGEPTSQQREPVPQQIVSTVHKNLPTIDKTQKSSPKCQMGSSRLQNVPITRQSMPTAHQSTQSPHSSRQDSPKNFHQKFPHLYQGVIGNEPKSDSGSSSPTTSSGSPKPIPMKKRRQSVFEEQAKLIPENLTPNERSAALRRWNMQQSKLIEDLPTEDPAQKRRKGRPKLNEDEKIKRLVERRKTIDERK